MPNFLMLNASPRNNGTAHMLCERLQQQLGGTTMSLYGTNANMAALLEKIQEADTIILIGPCYVNTFPGQVTELFEYLSQHTSLIQRKTWYGIIEGGMPYTHTHQSGLKHLEFFCKSCGMSYKGGFILTLAPVLNGRPLEQHFSAKKIVPAFDKFTESIQNNTSSPDSLYEALQPKMPLLVTKGLALFLSHTMEQGVKKCGLDPTKKSPYC